MSTFFDVVTVTSFVALVIAFFKLTDRSNKVLLSFLLSGVAFAVANQVGNHGETFIALLLVVFGLCFAFLSVWR